MTRRTWWKWKSTRRSGKGRPNDTEIAEDGDVLPQVLTELPKLDGAGSLRLLEDDVPLDAKKIVESGVFTFESLGGLVKGHCK